MTPDWRPRPAKFTTWNMKIDVLELIEGRGYRVKQSYGDAMAAALSTFYGETLHFVSGWLVH